MRKEARYQMSISGWWKDALVPEQATWLHFDGQSGAIENWTVWPPRHWRFQWPWFILEAGVAADKPIRLRYYFKSGSVCRCYKRPVTTRFVGVRVGPEPTDFAVFDQMNDSVPLICRTGQLSWLGVRFVDDPQVSFAAGLPHFPELTLI